MCGELGRVIVHTKIAVTEAPKLGPAMGEAATSRSFVGNSTFDAQCNQGVSNTHCEAALRQIRGPSGELEVGVQTPPGSPQDVQQLAWVSGSLLTLGGLGLLGCAGLHST